jgi:uncharacterized RmlC-like cupin family protein
MQRTACLSLALTLTVAAATLLAQNPVNIDNDQVRVHLATEQPHKKSAFHKHDTNRVMVYVEPGAMRYTLQNGKVEVVNFKPGDVRFDPGAGVMHTSENIGDKVVHFVEIELKKPADPAVKFPALDPLKAAPKLYKVMIDNPQVRVLHATYPAHENGPKHEHALPRVSVNITDYNAKVTLADGTTSIVRNPAGNVSYATADIVHSEFNQEGKPFEAILVDLKTK